MKEPIHFPYKLYKKEYYPIIKIQFATPGNPLEMVGDGSFIPLYLHTLPIRIGHIKIKATLGFSPSLGADFNLLGQKDIFDCFAITFDKRNKVITFRPY